MNESKKAHVDESWTQEDLSEVPKTGNFDVNVANLVE